MHLWAHYMQLHSLKFLISINTRALVERLKVLSCKKCWTRMLCVTGPLASIKLCAYLEQHKCSDVPQSIIGYQIIFFLHSQKKFSTNCSNNFFLKHFQWYFLSLCLRSHTESKPNLFNDHGENMQNYRVTCVTRSRFQSKKLFSVFLKPLIPAAACDSVVGEQTSQEHYTTQHRANRSRSLARIWSLP